MTSASASQIGMQLQGNADTHKERSKRKRLNSPAAVDYSSEELETGDTRERRSFDGSTSLSIRPNGTENVEPSVNTNIVPQNIDPGIENRVANIERILTTQQELLQRLVSAQEPPPPPIPTPEEIYERAREEAKFIDFHHWDSLYIHGLVLIDSQISRSMTKDPPCEPCAAYNRVCIILAEDDPYREFLFVERKLCCGWCEYATIPRAQNQRSQEIPQIFRLEESGSSDHTNHQNRAEDQHLDKKKIVNRNPTFFIKGDGIDWDVISTDIATYLGSDAVVRSGTYKDPKSSKVSSGFYVSAYRAPTSAMLADLRADSLEWRAEICRAHGTAVDSYGTGRLSILIACTSRAETEPQPRTKSPQPFPEVGVMRDCLYSCSFSESFPSACRKHVILNTDPDIDLPNILADSALAMLLPCSEWDLA